MSSRWRSRFIGWGLAKCFYKQGREGLRRAHRCRGSAGVRSCCYNKYYVDEVYDYLFTGRAPTGPGAPGRDGPGRGVWKFDANVIDGGVNGAGWLTRVIAHALQLVGQVDHRRLLVNGPAIVTELLSYPVRLVQWGLVQWYALVMVAALSDSCLYYVVR